MPAAAYTLDEIHKQRSELAADRARLLAALKELSAMYASTWDRVDGALVMMPPGIARFEKAHQMAQDAIAKAETTST